MSYDCSDVCDLVYEAMCIKCEHIEYCQNKEYEMNHQQMISCLNRGVMQFIRNPDKQDVIPLEEPLHEQCWVANPAFKIMKK